MGRYVDRGNQIRAQAKKLVLDYMHSDAECQIDAAGRKQSELSRQCGLGWGDYPKATGSNQQYWVVALLRELENEGEVEQVNPSGPWRLRIK